MEDRSPKRSLVDDPNFLASLDELDSGLSGALDAEPESNVQPFIRPRGAVAPPSPPVRPTPMPLAPPPAPSPLISIATPPPPLAAHSAPTPSAISLPEPPPWLPPTAFAAVSAASAALSAAFDAPAAPVATPAPPPPGAGGARAPRTLLDLFPPAASRDSTAPTLPLRDTAAPPPIAALEPPRVAVVRRVAQPAAPPTYETFYGLAEKPFAADPDLRFLYHSSAHDRALQELVSAIGRDVVVTLTGQPGLGKTLLCRALVDQLDRRTIVSFPSSAPRSGNDLLKTMLVDFGVISPADAASGRLTSASHDSLTGALRDFLGSLAVLQASALLVVDDAHALADDVLREVRALADIAASSKLLQIVLAGEPALARVLRGGDLRALDEQVSLRLELGPLEADETPGYVAHRLAVAGRGERVDFDDAALRLIFSLADGVPGVMNRICDRAMALGYQSSASRIDVEFVEDAAQQLGLSSGPAAQSWRDRALVAVLMLALMGVGAAGAGWVYREPLARMWTAWHGRG